MSDYFEKILNKTYSELKSFDTKGDKISTLTSEFLFENGLVHRGNCRLGDSEEQYIHHQFTNDGNRIYKQLKRYFSLPNSIRRVYRMFL